MPTPLFNLVTYLPAGMSERLMLTLDGDWTIGGGSDADRNSAKIPYTERSKLPVSLVNVVGKIEFWGTSHPNAENAVADVVRDGIWLVDVALDAAGITPAGSTAQVAAYRLGFADHRQGFREPRGGRLLDGSGNPDPLGDATLVGNEALINACLSAMGVTAAVPNSVNDVEPPRNITWFGAHAPSELGRLLQRCGCVYCCHSTGLGYISKIGVGQLPNIPAGRKATDITVPGISRMPSKVVFFSAPNAVVRTFKELAANNVAPKWEFVVRDFTQSGKWVP
ncbi:MAG TPA: hypothetical protein VGB55_02300, partial [Tepidisphaeraceae bacterium]